MSGPVTVTLFSNGQAMAPQYELISIDIFKEVNRIPSADVVLLDGDAAAQKFELSNTDLFKPGEEIEIKLRYEGDAKNEQTVFKGWVIRHGVKANLSESVLSLHLKDRAIALTTQRKNVVFRELTDTEIIRQIASDGGLEVASIADTKAVYPEMVQYYSTDWDFIVSRADVNGHWVIVNDGEVTVMQPNLSKSIQQSFTYGIDSIYDFDFEADIRHQYASVDGSAWDIRQQSNVTQTATDFALEQGNLTASDLGKAVGAEEYHLSYGGALDPDEVQAWAEAKLRKCRLSMLRGQLTIPGIAEIKCGDLIKIDGVGDRFNGKTLVTAIRHQVRRDGWQTSLQFGLSADWFAQQDHIITPPAAGLVPAIQGLQIGIIDQFEADPNNQFRVKVKIPTLNNPTEDDVIWARLASLEAGNQRGIVFRPEPGDEVVLGFLNDDPRQPIILGAMYSEKNALPSALEVTAENPKKGIFTREALQVLLDDENKVIEISTPNQNLLRVSDADTGIYLEDENGNKLMLNDQGIQIEAAKDIVMKGQDINIEGNNITIKGSKVDVN